MVDRRIKKICKILVDYSTKIKKGEKAIISADVAAKDMVLELYKLLLQRGAHVSIDIGLPNEAKIFYTYAKKHQLKHFPKIEFLRMKDTDAVFIIGAPENMRELAKVDTTKISLRHRITKLISDWRVEKTKWVIFEYPTKAMAKLAGVDLKEFSNFVFNSCLLNWKKFSESMKLFKRKEDRVNKVRIVGKNTDLRFSIKGRKAVVGDGTYNMPDGEVFTSVVENSANGHIYFEIPAVNMGNVVEGVYLEFKKGKVVRENARKNKNFLTKILNTDNGSRRLGEFGIGLNYNIKRSTKQILFDEKIGGTIHLAVGRSYKETKGKNESAIHWDFIKDLRKEGRVYFDGKLVMEKGKWLI